MNRALLAFALLVFAAAPSFAFDFAPQGWTPKSVAPPLRVLIVGIDKYPAPNTLRGCVNDARAWQVFFGKWTSDIRLLTDADATKTGIMSAVAWLATGAGQNVLVYSGHGTQVPDTREPDGQSEAVCPVDILPNWTVVTDDELASALAKSPGVCYQILDCCHSADRWREVRSQQQSGKARWMEYKGAAQRSTGVDLSATNMVILGACRAGETSAEIPIGGIARGAFSYAAITVWTPDLSLSRWVTQAGKYLRDQLKVATQHPVSYGSKTRLAGKAAW